jgi:hypothetical protein
LTCKISFIYMFNWIQNQIKTKSFNIFMDGY